MKSRMPHGLPMFLASGAALLLVLLARHWRRRLLSTAAPHPPASRTSDTPDERTAREEEPASTAKQPAEGKEAAAAAAAIQGWAACMRGKLRTVGKGYQPAEVLLVQKRGGVLRIDDCGGWSKRNESMERLLRAADASEPLPDFAPVLVQTTDRCFAQRDAASGALRLHLWQKQPLPRWLLDEQMPPPPPPP